MNTFPNQYCNIAPLDLVAKIRASGKLKPSSKRVGYVYVLEAKDGSVKIGRSRRPSIRINTIANQTKGGLKREYVSQRVTDSAVLETAMHKAFANCRLHGEWFSAPYDEVAQYCDQVTSAFVCSAEQAEGLYQEHKQAMEAAFEHIQRRCFPNFLEANNQTHYVETFICEPFKGLPDSDTDVVCQASEYLDTSELAVRLNLLGSGKPLSEAIDAELESKGYQISCLGKFFTTAKAEGVCFVSHQDVDDEEDSSCTILWEYGFIRGIMSM